MSAQGQIAFDEYGRPFIILRDQENQKRLTGLEAQKVHYVFLPSILSLVLLSRFSVLLIFQSFICLHIFLYCIKIYRVNVKGFTRICMGDNWCAFVWWSMSGLAHNMHKSCKLATNVMRASARVACLMSL